MAEVTFLGKPLTIERIKQAYERTKFKPLYRGTFRLSLDRPHYSACPLATVAVDEGACIFGASVNDIQKLGIPHGFIYGFDSEVTQGRVGRTVFDWLVESPESKAAYELGQQAAAALLNEEDYYA